MCVVTEGGTGFCHDGCTTGVDCGEGTVCGAFANTTTRACVPVASATGPNARAPYQRCSAGDACNNSACLRANASVDGSPVGTFCTTACPGGSAAVCPGYVADASSPAVVCLSVGTAPPQCHRACAAQRDCDPDGTVCIELRTVTGDAVRLCAPRG